MDQHPQKAQCSSSNQIREEFDHFDTLWWPRDSNSKLRPLQDEFTEITKTIFQNGIRCDALFDQHVLGSTSDRSVAQQICKGSVHHGLRTSSGHNFCLLILLHFADWLHCNSERVVCVGPLLL